MGRPDEGSSVSARRSQSRPGPMGILQAKRFPMRSITDRYTTANRNRPTRSSGWHYTRAALLARLAASLLLSIAAVGLPATPKAQADQSAAARSGAVEHAQKMRRLFPDHDAVSQALPTFIPRLTTDPDPSGTISSFHPNGPT